MGAQGEKKALLLSGESVYIKECNLIFTPPKIKEIAMFGEDNFFLYAKILSEPKILLNNLQQGNFQSLDISDFQLLMTAFQEDKSTKIQILEYLELIFPSYSKIVINERDIDFYIEENIVAKLLPHNFEVVQEWIADACIPFVADAGITYNPANAKAAEIAEKLKKGRQKAAEKKASAGSDTSIFALYTSILSIGMNIDINTIYNYTPVQLWDSYQRYNLKQAYDHYVRCATMPFLDVSKMKEPDDWQKNL